MLEVMFATVGGLAVGLALTSNPLRTWPVSEPLLALLLGVLLGPAVLGVVDISPDIQPQTLRLAAELILAISLMSIGLRFSPRALLAEVRPVALLLTAGLAGMALLSAALGAAAGLPLSAALLFGAVIAPTDPVLASSIVAGQPARTDLPERLRVIVSLEAGANDGLAVVLVMGGVALALGRASGPAVGQAVLEVLVGVAVGGVLGWATGRLVIISERHRDIEHTAFLALTLSLTACVYGVSKLVGGSALMAVFAAGIAYGHGLSQAERREEHEVQEAIHQYFILPVFTLFGAVLPWSAWAALGWPAVALAAGVLLLRRPPVVLALGPLLRMDWAERAFLGWFGPIGIAALFYVSEGRLLGAVDDTLWGLGTLVIAASTVVHGVTAAPGRRLFARHAGRSARHA